jgi:hypothetical protein
MLMLWHLACGGETISDGFMGYLIGGFMDQYLQHKY